VRALALPGDPLLARIAQLGCEVRLGDVAQPETLRGICADVETVFHLAAVVLADEPSVFWRVNVEGTRAMAELAADSGVRHFVLVSSASVVYRRATPYSRSKQQAERIVQDLLPRRHTIVRPTLVYERGGGEEFQIFVAYLRRFFAVPLVGDGAARKRPVHVDDLVAGMAALVDNRLALGRTYDLCGAEAISIRELAQLVSAQLGLRRWFVPLPAVGWRAAAAIGRLAQRWGMTDRRWALLEHAVAGLSQDADLDPSSAMRDLAFRPRGVREGLAECLSP